MGGGEGGLTGDQEEDAEEEAEWVQLYMKSLRLTGQRPKMTAKTRPWDSRRMKQIQ